MFYEKDPRPRAAVLTLVEGSTSARCKKGCTKPDALIQRREVSPFHFYIQRRIRYLKTTKRRRTEGL